MKDLPPCLLFGFLGFLFGFVSNAYGQDSTPIVPNISAPLDPAAIVDLVKLFGWPITFAFMAYKTSDSFITKLGTNMEAMKNDINRVALATEVLKEKLPAPVEEAHNEIKLIRRYTKHAIKAIDVKIDDSED